MNPFKAISAVSATILAATLAGCAGPAPVASSEDPGDQYRARVEAEARRQGTDVLWANPPRRASAPSARRDEDASLDVLKLRSREDDDG